MDFRTVIRPAEGFRGLVRHGSPILLMGSCFTDNIGGCLRDGLFEVTVNPFGPIYNPLSIKQGIELLCRGDGITSGSLFEREGMFHSFAFHSRYSDADAVEASARMSCSIREASASLRKASVIVLTLGTTRAFVLKSSGEVVANCHKLPSGEFVQRNLSLEETYAALSETVGMIRRMNPDVKIIFTVSPLRYLDLGAHGNQLSKSILLLAIDRLMESEATADIGYFPAYEVMMDDLRDYRFYASDMKHPSAQAVAYIYELFRDTYFDEETVRIAKEASALTRRLRHTVTTVSPEMALKEELARKEAAALLLGRYPKLNIAYERYFKYIGQ